MIATTAVLTFPLTLSNAQDNSYRARSVSDYRIVEFSSDGATVRGRLYLPSGEMTACPIIVMAHGYSATIDGMTADRYAEAFHEAGFAVLLYDHRNFGISGGEPRQEINVWRQVRGYLDLSLIHI